MNLKLRVFAGALSGVFTFCAGLSSPAFAAELALSDVPLFIKDGVDPNLIVTLDDSGSMAWAYVPDGISGTANNRRFKASNFNGMYYNPSVVYKPPRNADGTPYSTSFTGAYEHGFQPSGSWARGTRNLATNYRPTKEFIPSNASPTLANHGATGKTFVLFPEAKNADGTIFYPSYPAATEPTSGQASSGVAAYYYVFQPNGLKNASTNVAIPNLPNCDGTEADDDCYRIVYVGTKNGPADLDADGDIDTNDEKQNFANWYSFYRTRVLATASAGTLAFQDVGEDVRVAYQNLWKCDAFDNDCRDFRNSTSYKSDSRVKAFTGTHREHFYRWLAFAPASGGTPLRTAVKRAGDLLTNDTIHGPYAKNPGVQKEPEYACRPSFHIAMTDGIWNSDTSANIGNPGNYDSASRTTPGGCEELETGVNCPGRNADYPPMSYSARDPYADGTGDSLADLAFKHWITDARTDIPNMVPTFIADPDDNGNRTAEYWNARNDPAEWQHLTTFMVGFGLGESLVGDSITNNTSKPKFYGSTFAGPPDLNNNPATPDLTDGYPGVLNNNKNWPTVGSDNSNNPYDMWHAAINGRGEFFSADDPNSLVNSFKEIIAGISNRGGSAASVALDAGIINGLQFAYHARFNARDWTGDLVAFELLEPNFEASTTSSWRAQTQLASRSPSSRNIRIAKAGALVDFNWGNLSSTQQAELNKDVLGNTDTLGAARVDYLRGSSANESDTGFRERGEGALRKLLGDIVHSSPVYVGAPFRNGLDTLENQSPSAANSYTNFKALHANRDGLVFVGANDGMLHAFNATDGEERFAFIPGAVVPNLRHLSDPGYTHRFYVDGPSVAGDVFDGANWRSILVGTLRNGGKSVFALDVTDPDNIELLWEFSDVDLGYVYNKPAITRLHNGKWGVIIGNGYNSTNHRSVLYVLNAVTGAVMKKFDTGEGSFALPNGMASPSVVDINGDLIADYVYAGDLQGNVWRFNMINTSLTAAIQGTLAAPARNNAAAGTWSIAYGGEPLFIAQDEASPVNRQPITTNIVVAPHESGTGLIAMFGTGKYLESSDAQVDNVRVQGYYGIWDRYTAGQVTSGSTLATAITRNDLQEQTLSTSTTPTFTNLEEDGTITSVNNTVREVSENPVEWWDFSTVPATVNRQGWYIDFLENGTDIGEMLVTDSLVLGRSTIFATSVPNDDPCEAGIDRWVWALDIQSGGRSTNSVFDLNNDGVIDSEDKGPNDKIYNSVKIAGFGAPSAVGERIYLNLDEGVQTEEFDSGFANRRSWRVVR
jgi:type IV pilus assembly protein PilY1